MVFPTGDASSPLLLISPTIRSVPRERGIAGLHLWASIALDFNPHIHGVGIDGVYNSLDEAYRKAVDASRDRGESLAIASYGLAWNYYKQHRYQAAVRQFLEVLRLNAGSDFQSEAISYIADSLSNLDLVGPGEDDPFVVREDVLTREKSPRVAEAKMSVALDAIVVSGVCERFGVRRSQENDWGGTTASHWELRRKLCLGRRTHAKVFIGNR